jgi:probable phosphoglycerate mutase
MSQRLNDLIDEVRVLHAPNMHGEKACDVVLVAHGHVLRAFVKRWLGYPMEFPLSIMLEPGGIGILRWVSGSSGIESLLMSSSYQHHNIKEPALLVGLAVPALEKNG